MTPAEYIAGLEEPRRSEIAALDSLIREIAPELEPGCASGMLTYGPFHFKYASGREGDAYRIGVASRKTGISLYCNAVEDDVYMPEKYRERLPRAKIGKSCVTCRRLLDLDRSILGKLIAETAAGTPAGG